MADEERRKPNLIQDVNPSELGQLRPAFTPTNQEQQGWSREQAIGVGEGRNQDNRQSAPPELTFADTGTEDLSASARESAIQLSQNQLELNEKIIFAEREEDAVQEKANAPELPQKQRELETEQDRGPDHER